MHTYSINTNDKVKALWIIIPLSLLSSYLLNVYVLNDSDFYQKYSWIADVPSSALAFLGIYYLLFDLYVWKLLSAANFFKTPNVSGEYGGHLQSSRDNQQTSIDITIKITQTLSNIKVSLQTSQSTSKSEMAAIVIDESDGPLLIYEFINDHRKVADPGLTIHRGLTRLTFNKKNKTLKGIYYTSPERGNYGTISVTRK